jgi:hypothetical protein
MAAKVKCPGCGAKNDTSARRCRVCTTIINFDAPEPGSEPLEAAVSGPSEDHFNMNVINDQLRPAKARFGSRGGGGGLAARIAAASGAAPPTSAAPAGPAGPAGIPRVPLHPIGPATPDPRPGPTASAPPIDYDEDVFDPNALFADRDQPS